MSLADLTRHCFLNDISSTQWIGLCKLYISKGHTVGDLDESVCNSVLALYRSYPGDSGLRSYLKHALQDGLVTISRYVATLLQAAQSPEIYTPTLMNTLCRVALDAYSHSIHPIIPYSESPIVALGTIQSALALLRTAYSFSLSHPQLTASVSELLVLLLSRAADTSQVSSAQAMVYFADANDALQTLNLSEGLKLALQTFVVSLSLQIGDDAKAAREGHPTHTVQFTFRKPDEVRLSSNADTVTWSLILHHLVYRRGNAFGSGNGSDPVAILLGTWRWSCATPSHFYTQLLLSAVTCLSQCKTSEKDIGSILLWNAFILSRIPRLLVLFEQSVVSAKLDADWRAAMQVALTSILPRSDLIARCDDVRSRALKFGAAREDPHDPQPFSRDILLQFLAAGLINQAFATAMDPMIQYETRVPSLLSEAQEAGVDLEAYLDSKMTPETTSDDFGAFIDRVVRDPRSHADFAEVVRKRFASFTDALDVDSFHHVCRALYLNEPALDLISLHVRISDLIFYALSFLENYECETVGDPQTAISHLGHVVLFLQSTLAKYHLKQDIFTLGDKSLSSAYLRSTAVVQSVQRLSGESATAFNAWFKALFDSSSDGIEDTTFRSTPPKVLLCISATLISHAVTAYLKNTISNDVLANGVAYFTGSPLNWTLVGIIKALLLEVERAGFSAPTQLDILQTLLSSSECPRPVLSLCSPFILKLFRHGKQYHSSGGEGSIRQIVAQALKVKNDGLPSSVSQVSWMDQPQLVIREALMTARAALAPSLDIDFCVLVNSPSQFLELLWSELRAPASHGEMETCKRIITFVLTMPRDPDSPPLLPVFMHVVLPQLVAMIDRQHPQDQAMNIEFLIAVIASTFAASLHLEWALHSVTGEPRQVFGPTSAVMLRRVARQLHSLKDNPTSQALLQRLHSSFMMSFPAFAGEFEMLGSSRIS